MVVVCDSPPPAGSLQALLRAAVRLEGCRLEKGRARTRDRALLQLEALVGCLAGEGPPAAERMR